MFLWNASLGTDGISVLSSFARLPTSPFGLRGTSQRTTEDNGSSVSRYALYRKTNLAAARLRCAMPWHPSLRQPSRRSLGVAKRQRTEPDGATSGNPFVSSSVFGELVAQGKLFFPVSILPSPCISLRIYWSHLRESNPGPTAYKAVALAI